MNCPSCSADHKYKYGMKCACGYTFALDPKKDGMADGKFMGVIRAASGNNTYFFTEQGLYTAYCRRLYLGPFVPLVIATVFLGIAMGLLIIWRGDRLMLVGIAAAVGVLSFLVALSRVLSGPPARTQLKRLLAKWQSGRGQLEKLITEPQLHEPPPEWREPDIYDYGVERLLVVQRDILVDLLVKNNFHAEQRVLVLAETGYPKYVVPLAVQALRDNEQLPVFLLHDAADEGVQMANQLGLSRLMAWEGHPQIDLGLFPEDVQRFNGLKPLRPQKVDYQLPVDAIPYATLAIGLAQAMDEQIALGDLLAAAALTGSNGDGTTSFG